MFASRLPYTRVTMLADLGNPTTLTADLAALEEMAAYCLRADTAGIIHRELVRAFVGTQAGVRRLHRAELIHDPDDVVACGCRMPTAPLSWTLHRDVLAAVLW